MPIFQGMLLSLFGIGLLVVAWRGWLLIYGSGVLIGKYAPLPPQ